MHGVPLSVISPYMIVDTYVYPNIITCLWPGVTLICRLVGSGTRMLVLTFVVLSVFDPVPYLDGGTFRFVASKFATSLCKSTIM